MYAGELLKRMGLEVTFAENGRIAVDAVIEADAAGTPFDLVLMDCQMPELDGFDATRQIRRNGFTGPIVALTANAIKGDRERCLDAGMDDYITKPVEPSELSRIVAQTVKQVDATDAADEPQVTAKPVSVDPLNLVETLERCLNDAGFLAQALANFVTQTPKYVAAVVAAAEAGDGEATGNAAHSIKGSAGIVSAADLLATATEIEVLCRTDRFAETGDLIEQLKVKADEAVTFAAEANASQVTAA